MNFKNTLCNNKAADIIKNHHFSKCCYTAETSSFFQQKVF